MRSAAAVLALLILVLGSSLFIPAQDTTDNERAEIVNMIYRHDEAMNQHDLDRLVGLYIGGNSVVLGTGPGERYQGRDEIRAAYTELFKDFDQGSLNSDCYWNDGAVNGTTAWAAASCKLTDALGTKTREYELNISASLLKVNRRWRFSMLHFSKLPGAPQKTEPENRRH